MPPGHRHRHLHFYALLNSSSRVDNLSIYNFIYFSMFKLYQQMVVSLVCLLVRKYCKYTVMHLYQFTLSTSCPVCALNVTRTLFSGGENPETFDINSNIIILPGQSLTLSKEAPAPTGLVHQSKLGQLHTSKFGHFT
jgi:hypothetical protein